MFKALGRLFGGKSEIQEGSGSKNTAKSRLSFVLVQDRTGLTSDEMVKFRKELLEVIQRYFAIDEKGFDVTYRRESESTTLVINSPVAVRRKGSSASSSAISISTAVNAALAGNGSHSSPSSPASSVLPNTNHGASNQVEAAASMASSPNAAELPKAAANAEK